ncbi:MAG: hypothetical protein FWH35_00545 [Treponema sp.]|nr:hypothetical protein [Treponema sp.]
MDNPWVNLKIDKEGQYVLDIDRKEKIKEMKGLRGVYELKLDLFPEPFTGSPEAPVYLLNLNPGFSENDKSEMPMIKDFVFRNYKHQKMEYPFYNLDPKLKDTGGSNWWRQIMGQLLKKIKDDKLVSQKIFCIEYFPYHSKKYRVGFELKSQKYSRFLIKKAIKDKKLIVIMRKENELISLLGDAIKKHIDNGMVISCKNIRRPWISKGNFCDNGFDKIVERIMK